MFFSQFAIRPVVGSYYGGHGDANLKLEIFRFQMRLAKDLECLQVKSYAFAAKQIDEIGKLVGGWLRSGKAG